MNRRVGAVVKQSLSDIIYENIHRVKQICVKEPTFQKH
jgi:hypothetical protein